MSPGGLPEPLRCSECGAVLGTADGFCWICRRPLSGPPPAGAPPKPAPRVETPALPPPEAPRAQGDLKAAASMTPLTLAMIAIGAFVVFPPLGLVLCVCLLPALLSVFSPEAKKRGAAEGAEDKTFGARAQKIVTRVLAGFAIFLLVVGVIFVALFCVCLYSLGMFNR